MRRFLLILLILLLPLRAVAGDAMAVSMAAVSSQAMPADCAMAAEDGGPASSVCCDCPLCVAVADLQPPAPTTLEGLGHAGRATETPSCLDAALRPSFKPPKR